MLPVMLPTLAKCKTRLPLLDQNASSVQISDEHWMKSQFMQSVQLYMDSKSKCIDAVPEAGVHAAGISGALFVRVRDFVSLYQTECCNQPCRITLHTITEDSVFARNVSVQLH